MTSSADAIYCFADWQRWRAEGCNRLPFVLSRPVETLPASWERFGDSPVTVLLESAQSGHYSYLCDRPLRVISGRAEGAEIWSADGRVLLDRRSGQPLDVLSGLLRERKAPLLPQMPPMTGGLLGVFGYDLVQTWEKLQPRAKRDLALPLYAFVETTELFIYDHVERTLRVVVWTNVGENGTVTQDEFWEAEARAMRALQRWQAVRRVGRVIPNAPTADHVLPGDGRRFKDSPPDFPETAESASFSSEQFQAAARRALEYIAAGHTYQVNLSRRSSRTTALDPAEIFEALRRVNPSPYMGLLRLPDFALVCGSPELLVRLVDGVVSSRPIAGTRPRGDATKPDAHFSAELLASEKERAEHLMLVDLIRNDIGRVAEFGSVHVPEFMVLERYSHVMHIVSQVEGRLASGKNWADVMRSMFPGGTITGCPKIRTMEIIEELEPVGRGFYTGSLGWISYNGDMEMNIVIRSMLVQNGVAHVQAGAGIVADSRPDRELDESNRKAQALWVALQNATKTHADT